MSLNSLGLNTALLDTFGFTSGSQLGAAFGQGAVTDFIRSELGFANNYILNFSYEGYADKILAAQNAAEAAGLTNVSGVYQQILSNYAIAESYGLDINSITASVNSNGTVSTNTNLGGASINLNDALNSAISSGQLPASIAVPGFGTISPTDIFGLFFS